jgi:hypothetical protein
MTFSMKIVWLSYFFVVTGEGLFTRIPLACFFAILNSFLVLVLSPLSSLFHQGTILGEQWFWLDNFDNRTK